MRSCSRPPNMLRPIGSSLLRHATFRLAVISIFFGDRFLPLPFAPSILPCIRPYFTHEYHFIFIRSSENRFSLVLFIPAKFTFTFSQTSVKQKSFALLYLRFYAWLFEAFELKIKYVKIYAIYTFNYCICLTQLSRK